MSADFTPEKEDLKILTPFKMQVLTNFPYIEADFDALTNYQLLCKVVEYLNNVIAETNEVTEQTLSLYNAYVSLQTYVNDNFNTLEDDISDLSNHIDSETDRLEDYIDSQVGALETYVNNYFNNLDVQDEINNKLDDMVEDGTMQGLVEGVIPKNLVVLGDSWTIFNQYIIDGHPVLDDPSEIWCSIVAQQLNLTIKNFAIAGAGYTRSSQLLSTQYNNLLADTTINADNTELILVFAGINDMDHGVPANITSAATTLFNNLKTSFPKSQIIAMGCNTQYKFRTGIDNPTENNMSITAKIQQACYDTGIGFIDMMPAVFGENAFYGLQLQGEHPTKAGMKMLASYFLSCYNGNASRKPTNENTWTTLTPGPYNLVYTATKDDNTNPQDFYLKTNIINNELIIEFRFQIREIPDAQDPELAHVYDYTLPDMIIPHIYGMELKNKLYDNSDVRIWTTLDGNSTKIRVKYYRQNVLDAYYGAIRIQI